MEFKGIELHDVRELIKGSEGYILSRLPERLSPYMKADPKVASGVELRLVPIDGEVRIKLKRLVPGAVNAIVYYGSVQSGWQELYKTVTDGDCEIVIKKSPNIDMLKLISERIGAAFSPEVVRVVLQSSKYEIVDVIGRARPPRRDELPKRTYLAYGSSITHGSLSLHPVRSYAFRISEELGVDYLNLGFAGSALLEPEMADFIAEECEFDFATLEMGINMHKKFEPEEFERRARYFIKRIAEAHPTKKIFCIDIFYHCEDILSPDDPESRSNLFRGIIKRLVSELALPNTVYIPGLSILSGCEYLSEDLTHPNAKGVERLSQALISELRTHLALSD